jgi:hypothetical protein
MYNVDTMSACWKRNCWYRCHASGLLSLLLETEQIHNSWLRFSMKGGDHVRFHICNFKSIRELTDILNLFVKPRALVMKWQCKSLNFHFSGSTSRQLPIRDCALSELTPLNGVFETDQGGSFDFCSGGARFESRTGHLAILTEIFPGFLSSSDKSWDNTLMRPRSFPF